MTNQFPGSTKMVLSPAAQAVLDALKMEGVTGPERFWARANAAAALRAAAGQVVAMRPHGGRAWTTEQATAYDALTKVADHHLAIATELENHQ